MRESYRLGLDVGDLLRVVARLLRGQRRTEALLCRYLADLADGMVRWPGLVLFYGDVHQLARYKLGLTLRASRERVRVGKALRQLPVLCAALMSGVVAFSRIREVTRVARPDDEREWLQAARELSMRQLEQRVAAASARRTHRPKRRTLPTLGSRSASSDPSAPFDATAGSSPASSSVESEPRILQLPPHVWVLLERAMRGVRKVSPQPMTDAEALECVARAALAQQAANACPPRHPPPVPGAHGQRGETRLHDRIEGVPGSATQSGSSATEDESEDAFMTQSGSSARCQVEDASATQSGWATEDESEDASATQSGWATEDESEDAFATQSGSSARCQVADAFATQSGSATEDESEDAFTTQSGSATAGRMGTGDSANRERSRCGMPRGVARASERQSSGERSLNGESAASGVGEASNPQASLRTRVGRQRVSLSADAQQLLDLIKGGRLWNVVSLSAETGMPLPRLTVALTDLEFARRVARDTVGFYEVVAGEGDDDRPFPDAPGRTLPRAG